MAPSQRRRAACIAVALLAAAPAAAAAPPDTELAAFVRLWRASPSQDLRHLRALQTLAARGTGFSATPRHDTTLVEGARSLARNRAWPLQGAVVARFGEPAGSLSEEAMRISAVDGAEVVAPAPGRVVFGDRLDGIGLVLIIDHGDEYHSVLAGLGEIDVKVGAQVVAGQRVGHMAADADAAELNVELRRHGRPIDPLPWLGVGAKGDG